MTAPLCLCGCKITTQLIKKGDPARGFHSGSYRKYASHECYLIHRRANLFTECPYGHAKVVRGGRSKCPTCSAARRLAKMSGLQFLEILAHPPGTECEICGDEPSGDPWDVLNLDHDHETMKIRGWLCGPCNRGLGLLGDNIQAIKKTYRYLKKAE